MTILLLRTTLALLRAEFRMIRDVADRVVKAIEELEKRK